MTRPLRRLDPVASPLAEFGARLRQHRLRRGLTHQALGRAVYVSGSLIGKVERAQRRPASGLVRLLDEALGAGGELVTLASRLDSGPGRDPNLLWVPPI